jgi:hypothetical protein
MPLAWRTCWQLLHKTWIIMLFTLIAPSVVAYVFHLLWLLSFAPTILCLDLPPLDVSSSLSFSSSHWSHVDLHIRYWILVIFPWTLYYFPQSKQQYILLYSLCRNQGTCCTRCWLVARDSCLTCHLSSSSWIPITFGTRPGTMVPQTTLPKPKLLQVSHALRRIPSTFGTRSWTVAPQTSPISPLL